MTILYRKYVLLLLLLFTGISIANNVSAATACGNTSKYFYINGVSPWADKHRGDVANQIQALLKARGVITTEVVTPLRNPSEGILIDTLVELANQKLAEKSAANFADAVQKAAMIFTGNPAYAMSASDKALLIAQRAAFFDRTKNLPATSVVTAGMVNDITSSLTAGNKAIVIAHSQGNMFANAVLNTVTATQSANVIAGLKVVSIATPAASAQNNRYRTANQDSVISAYATYAAGLALLNDPLAPLPPYPANADVPGALNYDLTGHGLLEVYLNPVLSAVDLVVAMVINAHTTAVNPLCPQLAAICPDTFTQTQLAQVQPGMTVSQVDTVFGCAGRNGGMSNWYMWYNNTSLISTTLNTASVLFTNGVYLAGSGKSISGNVIP